MPDTYNYTAPEVYHNERYGPVADSYSLGMVMYRLLNERRMPFNPLPPAGPTASEPEEEKTAGVWTQRKIDQGEKN